MDLELEPLQFKLFESVTQKNFQGIEPVPLTAIFCLENIDPNHARLSQGGIKAT